MMSIVIHPEAKFLFIGDSITDCGRRDCPEKIGSGYVRMIRDRLLARSPGSAPRIVNRGISGNKVTDLEARWQADVLDEQPDVLSIYIGINDVWHSFAHTGQGVSIERYTKIYRELLRLTRSRLPETKIVLFEPSVIWIHDPIDANDRLIPYVEAVRGLAKEFAADGYVPLHGLFNAARMMRPDVIWAGDGVHPGSAGHALIAHHWLEATRLLG